MEDRGWDDVGYHYLVHPKGTIYEGRDLRYKGSHVEGANTSKVGILMMGDFDHNWWDFDDDDLSKTQLDAASKLILTLKTEFPTLRLLGGHRDYKKTTECPGEVMYKHLKAFRSALKLGGP
ncbi:putative N-acetylmuramoyl-L-alanine amidase [Cystobacter fuscus DSM 2262]|uniref:N-acetylmuramoyl-L-alanine amidase n=1 Tax=Cystobacter fuscus (strain ATCC 25194 / DSM 2262 / NBRC 100088 / M29) TaxID=1242864 RepID=S9P3M9_CYSF2|nr:peptidoglycan recognition family protein [Cystobacter fuscus]EPX59055.1 putative N-acetylmuramoyl-L-alanine amidase [Cystobacter fuscus DSM 2262]